MKILRFGLGVRFDVMAGEEEQATPEQLWEEVFSVLATGDVQGMQVYGGHVPYASGGPCYICCFTNGKLKEMRRIHQKLREDAGVAMYLTATHPFIQSNALEKVEGLTYFGTVQRDGSLKGGEKELSIKVCKKRLERTPIGRGIVFLLAPCGYEGRLTSGQAIRRLTIAARRHFMGVRILPLPQGDGNPGTVDAVLAACNGVRRALPIRGPFFEMAQADYAVLKGSVAVIEAPEAFLWNGSEESQRPYRSSFGIGEIIRRVLDEGITTIYLGCGGMFVDDMGLGCLRALGAKILDEAGREIESGPEELRLLQGVDTEFLHPRLKGTKFVLMTDCNETLGEGVVTAMPLSRLADKEGAGLNRYESILAGYGQKQALSVTGSAAMGGMGATLMAFCAGQRVGNAEAMLAATEINRRLKNVSLVVTGGGEESTKQASMASALMRLCGMYRVPMALITGDMDGNMRDAFRERHGHMVRINWGAPGEAISREQAIQQYDDVADRVFGFIRLGREIERVSLRKCKS